jgi:hypothetical protein
LANKEEEARATEDWKALDASKRQTERDAYNFAEHEGHKYDLTGPLYRNKPRALAYLLMHYQVRIKEPLAKPGHPTPMA